MNVIETTGAIIPERTPEIIAVEIRTIEENVYRTAIQGAVEIGARLKEIKEALPHGEWYDFVRKNLGYSERQAQNFMKISTEYGDENSPYFAAISKTHTCADLSISKALRLLQVPENDVENFVEKVDISSTTVKELEAEIKRLKEEKDAGEKSIRKLEKTVETERQAREEAYKNAEQFEAEHKNAAEMLKEAEEKVNRLAEEVEGFKQADEAKYEEAKEAGRQEAEEKMKEQLEKQENDKLVAIHEAEDAAREEEREKAAKEFEEQKRQLENEKAEAMQRAEKAEAKADASANEALIRFKVIVDDLQDLISKANEALSKIEEEDAEKAEKLRAALRQVIESCLA